MRSINVFVRLALLAFPVFASSEGLLPVKRADGDVLQDSYIVLLKDGYSVSDIADSMGEMNVTNEWTVVNGFTVTMPSEEGLSQLRTMPQVLSISENAAVRRAARQ